MLYPLCPAAPCYHSKRQGCTWFSQFVFSFQFSSVQYLTNEDHFLGLKVENFHQFSLSPFSSAVFTNHIDFPSLCRTHSFDEALTLFELYPFQGPFGRTKSALDSLKSRLGLAQDGMLYRNIYNQTCLDQIWRNFCHQTCPDKI